MQIQFFSLPYTKKTRSPDSLCFGCLSHVSFGSYLSRHKDLLASFMSFVAREGGRERGSGSRKRGSSSRVVGRRHIHE